MNHWVRAVCVVVALVGARGAIGAEPGYRITTAPGDPLLRQLQSRSQLLADAARRGDLEKIRKLRPAAANKALPRTMTRDEIKDFGAAVAPGMAGFRLVQLESSNRHARAVYQKTTKDEITILVQMYVDEGGWKVGANHTHNFVGRLPTMAVAIGEALKPAAVQLPR